MRAARKAYTNAKSKIFMLGSTEIFQTSVVSTLGGPRSGAGEEVFSCNERNGDKSLASGPARPLISIDRSDNISAD